MEGTGRYLGGATPALLLLLGSLGAVGRGAPLPRLRLSYKDLLEWNRTSILYADVGDSGATSSGGSKLWLGALLLDEYHERLFLGTRDALYSLRLDDLGDVRKISWPVAPMQKELCIVQRKDPLTDCSNLVRVLHRFNQTHLLACGTGAFQPICAFIYVGHKAREHKFRLEVQSQESGRGKCPFDTNQPFTSTVAGQQLFTGLFADFFGEDSAILRSSCGEHQQTMRTEHADQHLLHEPRFVYSRLIPETDDPDDDKVYFFFSETTTGSDGRSKARRARVARVCVNDAGGERVLVNKWTTFTKTRLVCSVPGPDGIDTHFDELVDVFVLSERDEKNPIIYGLFSTVSHVFHGFAVCVYRMVDVRDAFSGPYAQQYAGYRHMGASRQEKVPYPRPGFCPSRITSWPGAQLRGTRSYPDAVLHFARVHPLMARAVLPSHGAPVWHSAGPPECRFTSFTVDLVEAADGVYDVIFLGTDCGKVLKVVSINQMESGEPEAIILEEMQIFKTPMPITTMKISVKRGQLFVGSTWGVARVAVSECARYGNECAECCLARDPYCAWDGMACSTYQSFSRRRFRRQNVRNGDPFIQCLDQNHQGDLASRLPEHLVFGVERNSTLLECQPRSLQASVTWHVQHFHNGRRGQVKTDERVMATELGLLFRSLHRLDSGLYSCHAAEHGFSQTVGRYRLEVIANARLGGLMERTGDKKERPFAAVASSRQPCTASPVGRAPVSQPWFKGVMHLLGTSQHLQDFCQNIGCKAAWLRKGRSGRKGSSGKWALGQESKKRRRRHRTRTPRAAKPKQARRLN